MCSSDNLYSIPTSVFMSIPTKKMCVHIYQLSTCSHLPTIRTCSRIYPLNTFHIYPFNIDTCSCLPTTNMCAPIYPLYVHTHRIPLRGDIHQTTQTFTTTHYPHQSHYPRACSMFMPTHYQRVFSCIPTIHCAFMHTQNPRFPLYLHNPHELISTRHPHPHSCLPALPACRVFTSTVNPLPADDVNHFNICYC